MQSQAIKSVGRLCALAILAAIPGVLVAQDAPKPAPAKGTRNQISADAPSRWDIFAGYSYFSPKATVTGLNINGQPVPLRYTSSKQGMVLSGAYFFNKYAGLQAESGLHDVWVDSKSSNSSFFTIQGGLIFRLPTDTITPFVHGLVGAADVAGPSNDAGGPWHPYKWGPALTAGGGMDFETPLLHHRLALRLIQADYEYIHANWGSQATFDGGRANINAARLSTGLVLHVGSIAPPPQLTVACSANPASVFPGDPVNLTATAGSQDPKSPSLIYSWDGDGVKGNGANATVDTANLAPGSHTVKCGAKEGKAGKEGLKPWQVANDSTASFTVKEFEPPTISCSASPTTLKPGDSATVTSQATSPQNRPLTYTYSASTGAVSGTGNSATYSSSGAATGPVSITCNVADDKGHNASANTSLTIEAPPPPPQPKTQALCSINFTTDKKRPTRVDNEAKACLDEVALNLQRTTDAKAVVVGESNAKEKANTEKQRAYAAKHKKAKVEDSAAQRAVNTKEYLVTDKGIDPSRITVATGSGDDQKVENYLVPSGANFNSDVQGSTPVDESTIKAQVRKPLPMRHHSKKSAK